MKKIGMSFDGTFDDRGVEVVRYVVENPKQESPTDARSITCRHACVNDIPILARMNQHLIEDEMSRNPMSLSELESRMTGWINGDWQAKVIERDNEPVGYILFQFRSDEYRTLQQTVYVRQFFVERECRSRGIGRRAFEIIAENDFADVSSVVLDVLETNPQARHFWESLGFQPYCSTMKRTTERTENECHQLPRIN